MKRWIRGSKEYIEAMATVMTHQSPNFSIAVNPDSNRSGDCYFKYFDRETYSKAEHIARINIREASQFYHKNRNGKKEWNLNTKDKKVLMKYLPEESDEWLGVSNWESILYHWNVESHTIDEPFPKNQYRSKIEAFLDGFYDTPDNIANPSYVASYLSIPDYTKL